jgi:hypothetical protein
MPAAAIRRFALPCPLAGFVRPGGSGGLGKAGGDVGLFGSNIRDGTRLARRAGEIRSARTRGVAQLGGWPGSTTAGNAATGAEDAAYGAIRAARGAQALPTAGLVAAICGRGRSPVRLVHDPNRHKWPQTVPPAVMRHPGGVIVAASWPTPHGVQVKR